MLLEDRYLGLYAALAVRMRFPFPFVPFSWPLRGHPWITAVKFPGLWGRMWTPFVTLPLLRRLANLFGPFCADFSALQCLFLGASCAFSLPFWTQWLCYASLFLGGDDRCDMTNNSPWLGMRFPCLEIYVGSCVRENAWTIGLGFL